METTSRSSSLSNGLTYGVIAGLIYCISLYIRYNFIYNPIALAIESLLFFFVVIAVLVFCGLARKKQLGGFIDLRQAFQTIFIAVLVAELIYTIFNFIYLTYVDPEYFTRFRAAMETFFEKSGMSEEQRDTQLDLMDKRIAKQRDMGAAGFALSFLIGVAITGVCGFVVSLIIRKKKPVFDQMG